MNEIMRFENSEFGSIRLVMMDGDPWFVAKDVCECLDTRTSDVPAILDQDEHKPIVDTINTLSDADGLRKDSQIVSESGLYSLVLRSRKPEAKAFKRWVTHEVLPSIRKHGIYTTEAMTEKMLADPDFAISLLQTLKVEREQKALAEKQRDEAIRTKSWIDSKARATAMGHASAWRRTSLVLQNENEDLRNQIGDSKTYKTVKAQTPNLRKFFQLERAGRGFVVAVGKNLKRLSQRMNIPFTQVPDSNYRTVNAYHVTVWDDFFMTCADDPRFLSTKCPRRTNTLPSA